MTKDLDDATESQGDGEYKSAALDWAEQQEKQISKEGKKKFAIVGGGWGGWGAAKALCQSDEDVEVTLLDALPDPTGMTDCYLKCYCAAGLST